MNFSPKLLLTMVAGLITSTAMAQSNPEDHKAHHPDAAASAVKLKTRHQSATAASGGMHGQMTTHCKEMQRIMAIKDPAKRQKAIDAHIKYMKTGDCDMMNEGMGMDDTKGGAMSGGMRGDMNGGMSASSPEGGIKPMKK